MSEINDNTIGERNTAPLLGVSLLFITTGLLLSNNNFSELSRMYAPPGQTLYLFSKITAIFVYVLMWWQIMMGIFQKVNTKHHVVLGITVLLMILAHALLFISAASIRQEELNMSLLLPNFTNGYYKSGLSFGVVALFFILIVIDLIM